MYLCRCLISTCDAKASVEYTGREVWQKLHRAGGIHQVGGYEAAQSVCDATATWVQSYAPKGGRLTKHTKRGAEVVVVEPDAPTPTLEGKAPNPPPPQAVEGGQGGAPPSQRPLMWCHATDTYQTLVEQAAATGLEAALPND